MLPPGTESWQYVKVCFHALNFIVSLIFFYQPIPRHAICNVGDALALFSGGILRSNLHRVLYDSLLTLSTFIHVAFFRPPPAPQAGIERYSLVYFTRPGNSIILRALVDESLLIAEAVSRGPEKSYETGSTALEWFSRRIKNQRIKNRKVMHYLNLFHTSPFYISPYFLIPGTRNLDG